MSNDQTPADARAMLDKARAALQPKPYTRSLILRDAIRRILAAAKNTGGTIV